MGVTVFTMAVYRQMKLCSPCDPSLELLCRCICALPKLVEDDPVVDLGYRDYATGYIISSQLPYYA